MLTDVLGLITALITLLGVLLSLRKSSQAVHKIDEQSVKIDAISAAADGARESLHNHLAMIEAGIGAAADASAKRKAP